jgi:hypothetical protein
MKSLFEFINETKSTSDNSILYRLAKNIWNWTATRSRGNAKTAMDKYKISQSEPRAGLLRWFKDNFPPIPDASKEVIPRNQWDIDGIIGQSENQIMHKHYDEIVRYHCKHPDKRHDLLMIFEYSNKKPYNDVASNRAYLRLYDKYCDFANADYGLIPYAYCELYPYRYDEWDHYDEGEYGSWWYREVSKINFKIFMDAWGYKRCVVIMQNPHPRLFLKQIKEENLFGWGDKMDIVADDEFDEMMKKKYASTFGGTGLIVTRMLNLPETKLAVNKAVRKALQEIGGHEEDIKELKEIYKIINDTKGDESTSKALHAAGFGKTPAYAEWPYGPKETEEEEGEKKSKKSKKESLEAYLTDRTMVMEGMNQQDFAKKLTKLQNELDELDVDKIAEQKIEKDMGDDVDLKTNPDALFSKYEWAWPCGKLLWWMKGKKLDTNLQKEYDSLKEFMKGQSDWGCINDYFFYYKPITDKLGWKEKQVFDNACKIHFIEDHDKLLKTEMVWP